MDYTNLPRAFIGIKNIIDDFSANKLKLEDYYMDMFPQTWASTALGFPGCGESALTDAMTYVCIPFKEGDKARVYFDGEFAYEANKNWLFFRDLKERDMKHVVHSDLYNK